MTLRDPSEPSPDAAPNTAKNPAPDAAPDALATGTPQALRRDLVALLGPDKVLHTASDLVRYASDASPYRLLPQVVLTPTTVEDVSAILAYARAHGRRVVFRAAGTSLNGQAQGDDILVDVRRHWAGVEVLDGGRRARVRPGTVVARANAALAAHGHVLGPDPASSAACTIGGVVANNSSGMNAGTRRNSYRTVRSLTVVLPSGTVVDTGAPDADEHLARTEPALTEGLLAIKREIEADEELVRRIRAKYAIKNTNGYRLDAFLDADTPAGILRGLMVGSEGTLGFLAEIVFDTLPFQRLHSTALLFFPSLAAAGAAVPRFADAGAFAVELMDAATLASSVNVRGVPPEWARLPPESAALLVEFRAGDQETLARSERLATEVLRGLETISPPGAPPAEFSRDAARAAFYWKVRKGFVASVGGSRPSGTTLLTEDFCVPPHRLAEACEAVLELQRRHGFTVAVAGHAADGNLHFMITFDAADPADVRRYADFMDALCRMVVERFDGSLKAEHGTGRNMAPFLELEWGPRATALMWRIKELFDPHGVLAPGVLLDRDPDAHLKGLKTIPTVEAVADPCIECGFCEPVCPSRDLTTTPRQRIVLRREMMRQPDGSPLARALSDAYGYQAVDTCAGDSTCELACPVGIDTGAMMKDFRHARHSPAEERAAERVARRFALAESGAHAALAAADLVRRVTGDAPLAAVTGLARRVLPTELTPQWLPALPGPAGRRVPATDRERATAVYYPSCVNRIFGDPNDWSGPSLPEAVVSLAERAGRPVWIPDDAAGTCCATIWHSKGYRAGNAVMADRIVEAAWRWTDGGRLPLVVDASSCALGIAREVVPHLAPENVERHRALTVWDSVVWAERELLPRLTVPRPAATAVLHPTCSMRHLDDVEQLRGVAQALAEEVVVPLDAGCCGFAGDRGMLHEELTASATAAEAAEVRGRDFDAHLSANRTCEIGMEQATGRGYRHILLELERATRPE
ncbi:FAD-binding and (Fe-S)-binding domain-containing protein [Allostreptomyces psammosilenae]|uniref:D-lactate dehydrogenase (cytochrome) n=1 Tax=Allostreptomyces psammosilenae TaxID=1892865 RepID=A0A852ZV25_9ACTN|nr:FAD-binding and (Fe-S)-binding domain-containing protein [Allostreptomyces psammosilenae]NYI06226.1 D-lactate dehydrogenase [Allostreptomyces psammosilenae]